MNIQEHFKKGKKEETVKAIIKEAKECNKQYNFFNTITENLAVRQIKTAKGKLAGLPISVKDNICVQGVESTAGSAILTGYKPIFNATVIQKLMNEGAAIIGKTSQDEFGFGSFNVNIGLDKKIPKNPHDPTRVTGGSSGGSAGFTAYTKHPHVAIAESTGGSISCPAAFCGVAGLTPTYGLVSRYGLIDYANSLDKIGIIAKKVSEIQPVLDIIKGHDEKDPTSLKQEIQKFKQVKKVALVKEAFKNQPLLKKQLIEKLNELQIKYEEISLPVTEKYSLQTYYIIAMAEASTNLAKYCGMRYGYEEAVKDSYDSYFTKIRSKRFNKESKRRIILGTFARMAGYRDQYYLKAMQVRTLIVEEYKKAFKKDDVIITPTMPCIAPKFSEVNKLTPLQHYQMDILTVGPNLAGLPHLSVPFTLQENMPLAVQIIGDHLTEYTILNLGEQIERSSK